MGALVGKILRFAFSWIDWILAKVITHIYKLLMDMAGLVLYSDDVIDVMGKRIAMILGVFMLFKLATSIIGYIVSPDKISDAQKGGGSLIKHVIISLILLVTVNLLFKEAYAIQKTIIESQMIEKIFFGRKAGEVTKYTSATDNPTAVDDNGNAISDTDGNSMTVRMDLGYYLYTGLVAPNPEVFGDTCDQMWDPTFDLTNSDCLTMISEQLPSNSSIYKARNTLDISYVFVDYDLMGATSKANSKIFVFDYWPIISSVAGVILLLVLITFSMDLATRAVKLLFLQIIAPIPIISYMDLGKGQDIFKKWGKECINTYLSLFIRLIAIDFAVFMVILIRGNWKDIFTHNVWMNIFIILGCMMFAKQVPKLLEDFLGIKMDGMALNPLKKFTEQAAGAGLVGAGLAGAAALGANAYVGASDFRKTKGEGFWNRTKAFANIFGSSLGGAASATTRGIAGTIKGQKFGQVYSGAYNGAMTARVNRDDRQGLGIKPSEVWRDNFHSALHMPNDAQAADSKLKHYDDYVSAGQAAKQRAEGEIDKQADRIMYKPTANAQARSLGSMRDYYEHLKNSAGPQRSDSESKIRNELKNQHVKLQDETDGEYENRINRLLSRDANQARIDADLKVKQQQHANAISQAHADYFKARKEVTNAYINNSDNLVQTSIRNHGSTAVITGFDTAFATAPSDTIVMSNIEKMSNIDDHYGLNIPVQPLNIGASIQAADDERNRIRGGADYEKAQLIHQQAQKEKK